MQNKQKSLNIAAEISMNFPCPDSGYGFVLAFLTTKLIVSGCIKLEGKLQLCETNFMNNLFSKKSAQCFIY